MQYFIHITDPQFYEPPWPGVRRLGPYASKAEADTQADHDRTLGVNVEGVYSATESEDMRGND